MKKLFLIIFLFLFPSFCFAQTEIEVLRVYDGDSIKARIDDNIFRIRLIDIDCFEGSISKRARWQAEKHGLSLDEVIRGGNIAGDILRKELEGKRVYFDFMGIDKYGRALGFLFADEININQKMLQTPYCKQYLF